MSGKYYLVRRNQESLLGPHDLAALGELYHRKQCSINDEVSSNLGPWVYFRNRDALEKHYPEMVSIFHRTAAPKGNLVSAYEKYVPKPRKSGSLLLTSMLVVVVLLGVAAAAHYLYHRRQADILQSAMRHYRNADYPRAMEILQADTALIDKLAASLSSSPQWLPVLRTLAFWDDGQLKPTVMAVLREQSEVKTPADCSRANWRKMWRNSLSSWQELLTQQKLLTTYWSLLLSWDPAWLRERTVPHWHYPNSYEHACFLSAYSAFIDLSLPDDQLATVIRERIMWQARALISTRADHRATYSSSSHPLLVWNCLEQSNDLKTLESCYRILKTARPTPLVTYSKEKYRWNKLRILATQARQDNMPPSSMPSLASTVDSHNSIDYGDIIDYSANINNQKK